MPESCRHASIRSVPSWAGGLLAILCGVAYPAVAAPPVADLARQASPPPAQTALLPPATPAVRLVSDRLVSDRLVSDRLVSIGHSDRQLWNGVVLAPDGRVFVVFPRIAGNVGPSLATLDAHGSLIPYPGGAWNEPTAADAKTDPGEAFIGLNAIHLAPDRSLWVVDTGIPGFGRAPLPGAAKLVRFDLATNMATRRYILPADVLRPKSMIGDVRFNGGHAYITDAGAPGLIVLDLATGKARRLLDRDPSTTAQRPIVVDGETLKGPDNKPAVIHADQLEVSPDGKYLYYQPLPGPMVRISTALLDDPAATPHAVSAGVQFWYDTPALGGTAIGPDGTLYLNDVENDSVLSLTPERVLATVLRDPRLHWADAPFLRDGILTLPVAQLDRAATFHHGRSQVQWPVELFNLRLAASPSQANHR